MKREVGEKKRGEGGGTDLLDTSFVGLDISDAMPIAARRSSFGSFPGIGIVSRNLRITCGENIEFG